MPEIPSIATEAYTPSRLLAGTYNPISDNGAILSGENKALTIRGCLLGKVTLGAATAAAKAGGNTGNGTLTMDASTPILAGAQVGVYAVRVITAGTNSFTARVTDPSGRVVGDIAVSGANASGTFSSQVKFAIADAATDFVVGDGFDITVAAGSGKYRVAVSTNVDGSAVPDAILADDVDASGADVANAALYLAGEFNSNAMTFGAGVTAANSKDLLRTKGIFLKTVTVA